MCATGVLNVDPYGWPTRSISRSPSSSAGAAWLMLNRIWTPSAYDYPLIRVKYRLLLLIVPPGHRGIHRPVTTLPEYGPDVITSCCGALFSADAEGVAAEVSGLKPGTSMLALYGTGAAALMSGVWFGLRRSGGPLFAMLSSVAFAMALGGHRFAFISLYIYAHPHHHCPFCILKSGHDYAGYFLYIPLFMATAIALGAGVIAPWKKNPESGATGGQGCASSGVAGPSLCLACSICWLPGTSRVPIW